MKTLALLMLIASLAAVTPAFAQRCAGNEQEVLRDFEQILDLWRDGRYDALFERTLDTGKESRERFAKRLASAPRRPACCWEKMQNARVTMKGENKALVKARLGFEGGVSGTEFVTRGIKMKREDGTWLISQSDLFSLGNLTKKRTRYRYIPAR